MSFISEFYEVFSLSSMYKMGAGKYFNICIDSILGSYSTPGINFFLLNPSKNIASDFTQTLLVQQSVTVLSIFFIYSTVTKLPALLLYVEQLFHTK
jgi:hypothetical protein